MSLLFKPRHIPMIREGKKTATRRKWKENYPRPKEGSVRGAITELFTPKEDIDCWIGITDVYQEPLSDMTVRDFQKEGGYTREEFEAIWRDIYGRFDPRTVVDVVEFEYVGESR